RAGIGAIDPVHAHRAAAGHEAHDLVAGHRRTAFGQLGHGALGAGDEHAGVTGDALARRYGRRRGAFGELVLHIADAAELGHQPLDDVVGGDLVFTDRGVERGDVGVVQLLG